jgi:hypothetical protein
MESNPFRPEGELAREAEEFVNELKLKAERDLNELIHNTTSSTISQGALNHTVNEILSEPKELRTPSTHTSPIKTNKSPLKDTTNVTNSNSNTSPIMKNTPSSDNVKLPDQTTNLPISTQNVVITTATANNTNNNVNTTNQDKVTT